MDSHTNEHTFRLININNINININNINISLIKKLYGVQLCVLYLEPKIIWPSIV